MIEIGKKSKRFFLEATRGWFSSLATTYEVVRTGNLHVEIYGVISVDMYTCFPKVSSAEGDGVGATANAFVY